MLRYIAKKSTFYLISMNIIPENKKSIYIYGFELIWSFVIFIVCAVIMSIIFNYSVMLLVFFAVFYTDTSRWGRISCRNIL